jgi:pimeloyl-ACP methyl ester carboxylesterase
VQQAFDFRQRHGDKPCDAAVVLMHGLGGSAEATWEKMPELLLEEDLGADVAMCDYESGLRRKLWRKQLGVQEMAAVYAHAIRDAHDHRHFILVGHSMGGLVCKAVIKELLEVRHQDAKGVERLAGLFLIATPQAGSEMVRGLARWTRDGRDLRPYSKLAEELDRAFSNDVAMSPKEVVNGSKVLIPTFAVIPMSDRFVRPYSASVGFPDGQLKKVFGSHTSIVKPASRDDDTHRWIVDRMKECLKRARKQASLQRERLKQPQRAKTTIITSNPEDVPRILRDLPQGIEVDIRIDQQAGPT